MRVIVLGLVDDCAGSAGGLRVNRSIPLKPLVGALLRLPYTTQGHLRPPQAISVDNEQLRPHRSRRAARLGVIRRLVVHARFEYEVAPVFELGVQFAFEAQQDVPLHAPVIRQIAGGVGDAANM